MESAGIGQGAGHSRACRRGTPRSQRSQHAALRSAVCCAGAFPAALPPQPRAILSCPRARTSTPQPHPTSLSHCTAGCGPVPLQRRRLQDLMHRGCAALRGWSDGWRCIDGWGAAAAQWRRWRGRAAGALRRKRSGASACFPWPCPLRPQQSTAPTGWARTATRSARRRRSRGGAAGWASPASPPDAGAGAAAAAAGPRGDATVTWQAQPPARAATRQCSDAPRRF